ncbi:MAG: non-canonical purine NTP pyrophosphatase [Kaiparowitsia implicata GSE-PSE-MK54-09C]|jgi:non-canonical purine NTP pyrophosphatase (RdgB/HAM1 family)|nr:non-canonical purine NTP pyrophosphatase [Kaiparowitsia implicata GSE-PSE-MK54-09C]
MHDFLFVTHSRHKLAEAERYMGRKLKHFGLDLPELQSVDVEEVAVHKVKHANHVLKRPVLVDDTGLYIDAWNGMPGALVKWFMQRVHDQGICDMMRQFEVRSARAKTVLATCDETLINVYIGVVEGSIASEPRGDGYSWETIFIPYGHTKTLAEMTDDEKDPVSVRRLAFEALVKRETTQSDIPVRI